MTKVAVLTFQWARNHGALAQAYALKHTLERHFSCTVEVMHYVPPGQASGLYNPAPLAPESLQLTPVLQSIQDVNAYLRQGGFDHVISGSDAVLRVRTDGSPCPSSSPYWLGPEVTKGVGAQFHYFAASTMGSRIGHLTPPGLATARNALAGLATVSVRDEWSAAFLRTIAPRAPIQKIFDPTFMARDALRSIAEPVSGRYALLSLYRKSVRPRVYDALLDAISDAGLEVRELSTPENNTYDATGRAERDVQFGRWLGLIANCSIYVGVRFHPMCLAAAFGKPAIIFDNYSSGIINRSDSKIEDFRQRSRLDVHHLVHPVARKVLTRRLLNRMLRQLIDRPATSTDGFVQHAQGVCMDQLQTVVASAGGDAFEAG